MNLNIDNLIKSIKEFDYKRNGKEITIYFLATMIIYFLECDFEERDKDND